MKETQTLTYEATNSESCEKATRISGALNADGFSVTHLDTCIEHGHVSVTLVYERVLELAKAAPGKRRVSDDEVVITHHESRKNKIVYAPWDDLEDMLQMRCGQDEDMATMFVNQSDLKAIIAMLQQYVEQPS